jgi:hypothetical protein
MTTKLEAWQIAEMRPTFGARRVIEACMCLTDREKRVWGADLYWWQGAEGAYIGADSLARGLGLTADQVEKARRSLVALGLQLVIDRPRGKTHGRLSVVPKGFDPGERARNEECQALALILDRQLTGTRSDPSPDPDDPPGVGEGSARGSNRPPPAPSSSGRGQAGVEGGSAGVGAGPKKHPPDPHRDQWGSAGGREGSARGPAGPEKAPEKHPGGREGSGRGAGGVGGESLNPPELRSNSQSSKRIEQKIEGSFEPQEDRAGRVQGETVRPPANTPESTSEITGANWRDHVPRPGPRARAS